MARPVEPNPLRATPPPLWLDELVPVRPAAGTVLVARPVAGTVPAAGLRARIGVDQCEAVLLLRVQELR
jgi:hypothetical protein